MRAADVAKETDGRLGHGKHGVLRRHLILVVHRQTDAATHCGEMLAYRPVDAHNHNHKDGHGVLVMPLRKATWGLGCVAI